jgi:hypothetical protein
LVVIPQVKSCSSPKSKDKSPRAAKIYSSWWCVHQPRKIIWPEYQLYPPHLETLLHIRAPDIPWVIL